MTTVTRCGRQLPGPDAGARMAAALAVAAVTLTSGADTFDWIPPAGGSFDIRTSWSPAGGPPGALDTARFLVDSPSTSTVSFVEDVANEFLVVDALGWRFDLAGQTWSISGDYPCATLDGDVTFLDGALDAQWTIVAGECALDEGATWTVANAIYLPGPATMEVRPGTSILSGWIDVAGGPGGSALLVVQGPGAQASCPASILVAGSSGEGSLHALDGAMVESLWGELGSQPGSSGEALVTGGSTWNMASSVTLVGVAGDGALAVSEGGEVITGFQATIAEAAGSTGQVMLDGESRWTIAGDVHVGDAGHGVLELTTSPGLGDPVVEVGGALRVGVAGTGVGEVELFGAGSRVEANSFAVVGGGGEGHLTVGLGAETIIEGPLAIGELASGTGTVTLDGNFALPAPPLLDMGGFLSVGSAGHGELLAWTQGHIAAASCIIAVEPGSTGLVHLQFGPDLATEGTIEVGRGGSATLTVGPFSFVTCEALSAGGEAGADGHVAVTFGAITATDGALVLGSAGNGSLEASQAAQVALLGGVDGSGGLLLLGVSGGAVGTLELADAETLLDASGQVACGSFGEGTVHIRDGAELRARKGASPSGSAGIFGLNDGAVGSALVQSEGHLNCLDGALVIGFRDGSSGTLTVEDGGLVTSVGGFVGRELGAEGAVVVTGVGSLWDSGGTLDVGIEGSGTVEVTAGGRIEAGVLRVGPNGVLAGDGSIEGELENAGTVAPGPLATDATLGALMLEGGYSQSETGRLVLEVGGTGPGEWDRLQGNFTGFFDLGGTLELQLVDGFVPAGGEVLIVIAGGFMVNDFDALVGPVPFTFAPGETVGIVTFCLPADLNCDGVVNGGDLGIQLSQWGGPGTGDLNHDGVVNGADVGLLLAAWSG